MNTYYHRQTLAAAHPEERINAGQRMDSLDYLRGIAAVCVMFYHFYGWTIGANSHVGLLSKMGLYAVSIFYVLSGLTLYIVYVRRYAFSGNILKSFFIKRFFRIFPLLWLTLTLNILISDSPYPLGQVLLNYTGLFGVFDWDGYIGTGVWSIGNELAFYLLFVLLWYFSVRRGFIFCYILFVAIYIYFAFYVLKDRRALSTQWSLYVNPLNQAFFFVSGMAIGKYAVERPLPPIAAAIGMLLMMSVFTGWDAHSASLVSGIDRVVLGISTVGICLMIYFLPRVKAFFLHKVFKWLGEISYAVYLLHPIIYGLIFKQQILAAGAGVRLVLSVLFTFVLATLSYLFFEKRFVGMGNRFTKKIISARPA
jgi:exopolysaccharide production protein ExoZ